jgi:hypothetical protein
MILNGLFHVLIVGEFFNDAFAGFDDKINKMADANITWLAATEIVWITALFYLLTFQSASKINIKKAVAGGMLMNASISGTWNFINASLFTVFPTAVIIPDMSFHILIVGSTSGLLIATLYNRLEKKQ